MAQAQRVPKTAYRFNARLGLLHDDGGERMVLLPAALLRPLFEAVVEHGDLTALRQFGMQLGGRLRQALPGGVDQASVEEVLSGLCATLGCIGWGRAYFERWGPALVLCTEDAPTMDAERLSSAAVLGGVLSALVGQEVACVPGEQDAFLVVDPKVAEAVWTGAREGMGHGEIVSALLEEVQ